MERSVQQQSVHRTAKKLGSINLAVVERAVENYVFHGENHRKKLRHENVVRAFKTIPLKEQGEIDVLMPALPPGKVSIVLYIQNKQLQVLSAFAKKFS